MNDCKFVGIKTLSELMNKFDKRDYEINSISDSKVFILGHQITKGKPAFNISLIALQILDLDENIETNNDTQESEDKTNNQCSDDIVDIEMYCFTVNLTLNADDVFKEIQMLIKKVRNVNKMGLQICNITFF